MPLWVSSAAAARQFHAREGDLNVPHKPFEDVGGVPVKLGRFLDNTRRRASKLTPSATRNSLLAACAGRAAGGRAAAPMEE
ncbi:helicase associated domain-containing protein [Streptomyces mirabilis]|uniref:helicase associated domain-containing protein n=1 Tax=Streptomyces mirabilis TaxID=68239 RepID=UPI003722A38C